ncbi:MULTISPECIES: DUF3006 domain-containing protein [Thermoanaerobacter]|uniref:Uncharacterized protein n=2 Tax=Thermoanaerobacter TaxID=1754 RepID=B0KAZ6_THEP3|nr:MULTISPECIES: DUF3006 domain-containing protein [Thermoanaerobacter]ABY93767.1 hypothetical protein Teth39_0094 [Thermoanaerobacter pseudethanolicus ATCC 33223]ADV78733.1 hypothetical protein Thebr_0101 [Thermoanaerobacter brockii subsp. finnii Ako-1]HBW58995.1 DUF3006 domain-containing protein [Thermoanaerobacter sp.]
MPKKNEICVIDRFEGDWAVIEWKDKIFNFPRELLPKKVNEGDVLIFNVDVDKSETEKRKKAIEDLAKDLFKDE